MKKIIRQYRKFMVIFIMLILLVSCSNKSVKNTELFKVYDSKGTTADFIMITSISETDNLTKSEITNATIEGTVSIEYISGTYSCTLEKLKVHISANDASIEYDSSNTYSGEENIIRNTPYRSFVGVTFKAIIDSEGNVSYLNGYEKVAENIVSYLQQYGSVVTEQALHASNEFFDANTLKQTLEMILGAIPEMNLKERDTWVHNHIITAPYAMTAKITNEFSGKKDDRYIVMQSGLLQTSVKEEESNKATYALTGSSDSKITIYTKGSLLRSGTYTEKTTGYCYYEYAGEKRKDTINMSKSITFSLSTNSKP